jgi:protease-4
MVPISFRFLPDSGPHLWEKHMVLRRALWAAAVAALALTAIPPTARAADPETKGSATVAHIKLSGGLDESPVAEDPLFGTTAENFKTKLERIKKAKDDASIQGLYLQVDELDIGWGKVDELCRAIADFRKAGKKAYAYMNSASTKDYLVAAACDEVCMPESGSLMLIGLRAEVTFYKDLFDKIGVKADMVRMGDFKSAVEPLTRSSMSKESKQQLESMLDDYFANSIVARIAKARAGQQLTEDKVKKIIDEGPYTAKAAKAAGLIDRIAYDDGFEDGLKTGLNVTRVKVVKNYEQAKSKDIDLSNPFALLKALMGPSKPAPSNKPKIAVIYVVGTITSGKSINMPLFGSTVGSTTIIEAIRQAEQDKTVKAIVLRVDSPGGSALASDLMWNELRKSKKPIIASMSDVAASGGYYVCMSAGKIYAEPGTLTGSIGVFGGKITYGGTEEKLGLHSEVITRGANANIFSGATPFSDSERKAMTSMIQDTYDQFLDKALAGRKKAGKDMKREDLVKLAGGRIWTGRQAKENGLIDELGSIDDAVTAARKAAGVAEETEMELLPLPKPASFFETLMESKGDVRVQVDVPLLRDMPELTGKFQSLGALLKLRGEPVWVIMPYRLDMK